MANILVASGDNVQQKLNSANAGDTIDFGSVNSLLVNGQLTLKNGVTYKGSGATLDLHNGNNQFAVLFPSSANNITIDGLKFRANCGVILINGSNNCSITNCDFVFGYDGTYYNRLGIRALGKNNRLIIERNNFHDSLSSDRNVDLYDTTDSSYSYNTWYRVNDGGHLDGVNTNFKLVGNRGKEQHRMFFELQDHGASNGQGGPMLIADNVGDGNYNVYGESWFLSIMPQRASNVTIENNYGRCYDPPAGGYQSGGSGRHGYGIEAGFTSGIVRNNILVSSNQHGYAGGIVVSMPNTRVEGNKTYGNISESWGAWIMGEGGLSGNGSSVIVNNQIGLPLAQAPAVPTGASTTLVKITSPAASITVTPGQSVTATGTGDSLKWDIDRIGDGLSSFATGSGASVTFKVPADATAQQQIRITLTGTGGTDTRDLTIVASTPPPPPPKSITSVTLNFKFSDGTSESITRP